MSWQKQSHTVCLQSWCKFSTVSMKWKEFVRSLAFDSTILISWFGRALQANVPRSGLKDPSDWLVPNPGTASLAVIQSGNCRIEMNRSVSRLVEFTFSSFMLCNSLNNPVVWDFSLQLLDGQVMIVGRSFDRPSARQTWCITLATKTNSSNLILDSALR